MSILITFFFLVLLVIVDVYRQSRLNIDAFRLTLFIFGLVYILIPEVLPLSYDCEPYCNGVPWLPRIISIIGLAALLVGYLLFNHLPVFRVMPIINTDESKEFRFAAFVFMLSVLALYLYAHSMGGFLSAFSFGALNRMTGEVRVEVKESAVASYFAGLVYLVFALSQYNIYQKTKYRTGYIVLLLSAFLVNVAYALIKGGRGAIFMTFLLALFIHLNVKKISITVKKATIIIMIIVVGVFFIAYGKKAIVATSAIFRGETPSAAFDAIESKELKYVYGRMIYEFAHPIKSMGVVLDNNVACNYMEHFWVAPLHLIPSRILGLSGKPYRISELNTYLLIRSKEGGMPPGLVASFWYGGGLLGVIMGCAVFGGVIAWGQRQCYTIIHAYPSATPIVLYGFFRVGWFVNNGDPSVFLKHEFHFLVFLILIAGYYLFGRIRFLPLGYFNAIQKTDLK